MKTWNDKFSIKFEIMLSRAAVDEIKETVVPLGKKMHSSCYRVLGVIERDKEEMEREIFSWINVEDISYPNDTNKINLNNFYIRTKVQPLELPLL